MLTAGSNVTVSGTGQAGDPWVINANATPVTVSDTPTVDLTLTGVDISGAVKLEPVGNLITVTANGLLVNCAAVQACDIPQILNVVDTATVDLTLTGDGSPSSPWMLKADAPGCICSPPVTTLDTDTVDLSPGTAPLTANVRLDPAVGNILTSSAAGVLAQITPGCGLTGSGSAGNPLIVKTAGASPYTAPCRGKVYCDVATGLSVDAEKFQLDEYHSNHIIGTGGEFPANTDPGTLTFIGNPVALPVGTATTFAVTNPSACRSMRVRIEVGIEHLAYRAHYNGVGLGNPAGTGRENILFGAMVFSAGGIVIAPGVGQNHQAWLFDAGPDGRWDEGWDINGSNYLTTLFTLAPGAAANMSLQGTVRVINDTADFSQVADWSIFTRVTGFSI